MRKILFALVLLFAAGMALAAPPVPVKLGGAGSAPISIEASSMELRGKERVAVFTGDVKAIKGEMAINADSVEVYTNEDQSIKAVNASGNVRLKNADIAAVAGAMAYDVAGDSAVLTGEPKVWRGRDAVGGEKITIHFADSRIAVEKASAVLFPEDAKKTEVKK